MSGVMKALRKVKAMHDAMAAAEESASGMKSFQLTKPEQSSQPIIVKSFKGKNQMNAEVARMAKRGYTVQAMGGGLGTTAQRVNSWSWQKPVITVTFVKAVAS